jgi:hypothetical protein
MAKKPLKPEPWMAEVAQLMVKTGLNFRRAAETLGHIFTPDEADNFQKRDAWERVLRFERYKYLEELAADPQRTKNVLLGGMVYDIQRLREDGNYEKSLDGSLKLARVEFGIAENQVNVLGTLNQEEINKVRERIKQLAEAEKLVDSPKNVN